MNWLAKLVGLDRAAPVDETRRKILKTAVVTPLFIPVLSGLRENIDRPASDKANMLDFMTDVLTVTILGDETNKAADHMVMSINGSEIVAPINRQIYIQRNYVELLVNTRHMTGIDDFKIRYTVRFPFVVHHDPAGETGKAWLIDAVRRVA